MVIRFAQGGDITLPCFARINQIRTAPAKAFTAERYEKQISRKPCMTAIAIGIRMNPHKPVMKARRKFIRRVGLVGDLVRAIINELA